MTDRFRDKDDYIRHFTEKIRRKEKRKLQARDKEKKSVWFGLGAFGVIGWMVMIPTLIGLAVGIWLDISFEDRISWTITFLMIGVFLGCFNAWRWIKSEQRYIEKEKE